MAASLCLKAATITVANTADAGPGSLRQAIANAALGDIISFADSLSGKTITLNSTLVINQSMMAIQGNGLTLSGNDAVRIMSIHGSGQVVLSRLHFTRGRDGDSGGALYNDGRLFLKSCMFSYNSTTGDNARGGALYSNGSLYVGGCTFYRNSSDYHGGALFVDGGTATLTGNIFYGNTAGSGGDVVYRGAGAVSSGGYNLHRGTSYDVSFGAAGDATLSALPFAPPGFKPLAGTPAIGAIPATATLSSDYPTVDFYGSSLPPNTARQAGAVQQLAPLAYTLTRSTQGPGVVHMAEGSALPDSYGLYNPGSAVALVATSAGPDAFLRCWVVNDTALPATDTLHLTMNNHKMVEARFAKRITVATAADAGPGSLRQAIIDAAEGDIISFADHLAGATITLAGQLSVYNNQNISIQGNGLTISGNDAVRIMYIYPNATVSLSRLHLTRARSVDYGGAVYNAGTLRVESCIFSHSSATGTSTALGGALYSRGALTLSGCTFYRNSSAYKGGVLYATNGTAILTGNIFYGNTAGGNLVYHDAGGTVSSGGYNLYRGTSYGFAFDAAGDAALSALPFAPTDFKPLAGSPAVGAIPSTALNSGYPVVDFYGSSLPPNTARQAGAVQQLAPLGYLLRYSSRGPGALRLAGGGALPYADSSYAPQSAVALVATPAGPGAFLRSWVVNDTVLPAADTLRLTMNNDKTVVARFARRITVATAADAGPGSLRQAIADAAEGDIIGFADSLSGKTISLNSPLTVDKNIDVEGNGLSLSGKDAVRIMNVNMGATVSLRRLHLTRGRDADHGGAVSSSGTLRVESCIFSHNSATGSDARAGALYSNGPLTVSGCTFYRNSSAYRGGVLYANSGTATLTGNIFYGNTAGNGGDVVYRGAGTVNSGGYNLYEGGSYGFAFAVAGDATLSAQPFAPASFKPLAGSPAIGAIPATALNSGYPVLDFYGSSLPPNTARQAGAVQQIALRYLLRYSAQGPGTVGVAQGSAQPDADGLYAPHSAVALVAAPAGSDAFLKSWVVNNTVLPAADTLHLTINGHKTVLARFAKRVTVTADTGVGSLRQAIANAAAGDTITFADSLSGKTITLSSPLTVDKNITIQGNGLTLSGKDAVRIMNVNLGITVSLSRLHLTRGRSVDHGGAVHNRGALSLQSCIFSHNRATANFNGGALYSLGALTVSGCTFYRNSASQGGALFVRNTFTTLTGNIFYGNTAGSGGDAVYCNAGTVSSGGYNLYRGTSYGFAFGAAGDATLSAQPFAPVSFKLYGSSPAMGAIPATALNSGYPVLDFYGDSLRPNTARQAGAVQQATLGYQLRYSAQGPGTVGVAQGSALPDADSLYAPGSAVALVAMPAEQGAFLKSWLVNNTALPAADTLRLTMNGNKTVLARFARRVAVTADDGAGSLRQAIAGAATGDTITFADSLSGKTITLSSPLTVDKNITIQGNGLSLSGNDTVRIMNVNLGATVSLSRLHLTRGRSVDHGGAMRNAGALRVESCIFSDNSVIGTSCGGALYSTGALTLSGCTFYRNSASQGGVLFFDGDTAILTGNIFYGNTAGSSGDVVYCNAGTVSSGGYNLYRDSSYGFTFGAAGDSAISAQPFAPAGFKLYGSSPAVGAIPAGALNSGYPVLDFYGDSLRPNTVRQAGAVQRVLADSVRLSERAILLPAGGDSVLHATVLPAAASHKELRWLSRNPAVATVSGSGRVSALAVGTTYVVVTARDGEITDSCLVTVSRGSQSISWTQTLSATVGDAPVALSATASSGLEVSYTSSNTAVATVSGSTLSIVGAGTATITATQAGNDNYEAAGDVAKTLTVSKKAQSISWTQTLAATVGDAPVALSATAGSGLEVSYTSSNTAVATVSGSTLTIVGAGTSTITATQAGNDSYKAAGNVEKTLTVAAAPITAVGKMEAFTAKLYPNPVVNGELSIDNGELAIGMVEIVDSRGAVVFRHDFGRQTQGVLPLPGLHGTYFVRMGRAAQAIVVRE